MQRLSRFSNLEILYTYTQVTYLGREKRHCYRYSIIILRAATATKTDVGVMHALDTPPDGLTSHKTPSAVAMQLLFLCSSLVDYRRRRYWYYILCVWWQRPFIRYDRYSIWKYCVMELLNMGRARPCTTYAQCCLWCLYLVYASLAHAMICEISASLHPNQMCIAA